MKTFTIYKNSRVTLYIPRDIVLDAEDIDCAELNAVEYIQTYGEVWGTDIELEEGKG